MNRSLSLSEFPTKKQIRVQHAVKTSGNTLLKYYSCEQISYSDDHIKIERLVQEFCISKSNAAELKENQNLLEKADSFSVATHNITPKFNSDYNKHMIRHLSLKSDVSEIKQNTWSCWSIIVFIILPAIFIVAAIVASSSLYLASYLRHCEMTLDVTKLKYILENNLFGQEDVINEIVSSLRTFSSTRDPGIKILVFTGGTGVGKSYTTSLISDYFPWENIQKFVMPLQADSLSAANVYAEFSYCGDNLLIMDGLLHADAIDVVKFLQSLNIYMQDNSMRVIIMLVFSNKENNLILQGYSDPLREIEIESEKLGFVFKSADMEVDLLSFQPLKWKDIALCIEKAVSERGRGLEWSSRKTKHLISILPPYTGCKGVASKLQLVVDTKY